MGHMEALTSGETPFYLGLPRYFLRKDIERIYNVINDRRSRFVSIFRPQTQRYLCIQVT